jgi:hypothetical protein
MAEPALVPDGAGGVLVIPRAGPWGAKGATIRALDAAGKVRFWRPPPKAVTGYAAAAPDGARGAWLVPMYAEHDTGFGRALWRNVLRLGAGGVVAEHRLGGEHLEVRYLDAGPDGRPVVGGLFGGSVELGPLRLAAPGEGRADFVAGLDGGAAVRWGIALTELHAGSLAGVAAGAGGSVVAAFVVSHGMADGADLILAARDASGAARWSRRFDAAIGGTDRLYGPFTDARGRVFVGARHLGLGGGGSAGAPADGHFGVACLDEQGSVLWTRTAPFEGWEASVGVGADGHLGIANVREMDLVVTVIGPAGEHVFTRVVPLPATCRDSHGEGEHPIGYAASGAVDTSSVFASASCAKVVDEFRDTRELPRAVVTALAR